MKPDANPMHSAHAAPRCGAHSKRSGLPCRAPAVRGWRVCRMHGAGGGAWKHGGRSGDTVLLRRLASTFARVACDTETMVEGGARRMARRSASWSSLRLRAGG
jgi:hypothetical protein